MNQWLQREGYLKADRSRSYFEQIDRGTKAFVLDPGRLYINVEGKYPLGCVKHVDRKKVMNEIKSLVLSLEDRDGCKVVKEIRENEVLYTGPWKDKGPDLVCTPHDGYDLKGTLSKQEVMGRERFTGMHTAYDAHCILPCRVESGGKLHIEDLAALILNHFASN
jgi:predicted AlkP superfamily phosphohydrolase/phosphomutase